MGVIVDESDMPAVVEGSAPSRGGVLALAGKRDDVKLVFPLEGIWKYSGQS